MKIVGVIPARYASTRFPAKPLIDIGGKSMIQRVYEQAIKTSFDRVIIATDDQRIFDHVATFGAEVMMTSTKHLNGTERCAEVIARISEVYDVVVNIQGDEPFVDPEMLRQLSDVFDNPKVEIATLIKKIDSDDYLNNPSIIKVVKSITNKALFFSRSQIPYARNRTSFFAYFKHIGIYAFRIKTLLEVVKLEESPLEAMESLEQLRWLENGYPIQLVETSLEADSIDTPEDLVRITKKYLL